MPNTSMKGGHALGQRIIELKAFARLRSRPKATTSPTPSAVPIVQTGRNVCLWFCSALLAHLDINPAVPGASFSGGIVGHRLTPSLAHDPDAIDIDTLANQVVLDLLVTRQ